MSDVVELGLRKAGARPQPSSSLETSPAAGAPSALKGLAEAFLKLMADFSPDADDEDAKTFAAEVKDFRDQIALSGHEQETRRLAVASIKACEQFLKKSRQYFTARDETLTEMIGVLRDTARHFAGDNGDFHAAMKTSTDRFYSMAQLHDISEMKKQLREEASTLQKTLESKQKRDEAILSALTERVEMLQKNLVEAKEEASLDPLTKIPNRRTFDRALSKAVKHARVSKTPLALAMVDIDRFKSINDTHSHPIGDRVILCVAQWITAAVRHTDLVARYGGEEFAIILPDADLQAAETRFKAVLQQIAERSFEYEVDGKTRSVRFTVSCGVTQLASPDSEHDLVQRADHALYDAKRNGRNRVVAKKRSVLGGLFG